MTFLASKTFDTFVAFIGTVLITSFVHWTASWIAKFDLFFHTRCVLLELIVKKWWWSLLFPLWPFILKFIFVTRSVENVILCIAYLVYLGCRRYSYSVYRWLGHIVFHFSNPLLKLLLNGTILLHFMYQIINFDIWYIYVNLNLWFRMHLIHILIFLT